MKGHLIFAPALMVLFFVSGVLLSPPAFSDYWWVYEHDLTTEDLNFFDVEGFLAVGNNGVVLMTDYPTISSPQEWWDISPPTSEDLYGAFLSWGGNNYVVGTSGTIVYSDSLGGDWTFYDSPTFKDLYSIVLLDDEEGFIVGEDGTILFGTGDPPFWQIYESSPTNQDLFSVHGYRYNPNITWAVGAGGTILDYEDGVWSLYPDSPTMEDLYCVFVDDYDDAWACGGRGTILRWDGAVWSLVDTPTTEDLYCIWRYYCVGENGTILASYYSEWYIDDCPVTEDLHGVAGSTMMWAVGDVGTIIGSGSTGIQPISVGKVKALFAPSVEAFGAKDDVKER